LRPQIIRKQLLHHEAKLKPTWLTNGFVRRSKSCDRCGGIEEACFRPGHSRARVKQKAGTAFCHSGRHSDPYDTHDLARERAPTATNQPHLSFGCIWYARK
ncbi:hypothetical protein, partial [Ancylobacter sp. 3268]|uniref:hypothetical protein n=1 Tax=Ancylobacter sp. 3268 TaxID=2817752 RepID=UPI00286A4C14